MGHDHHHHHHEDMSQKNILIAFALNFSFAIIELVGGFFTNSVSIMSDALHDFGDSLALLLAYFAQKVSSKDPDEIYTFGYRRFSILSAFINAVILLAGSIFVIIEAIKRIASPEVVKPEGMLALAILGVVVNSYAAFRLSKDKGLNSKMVKLHLLEDVLGWLSVLVVSIILIFKPWYFLDSVLSILISVIILRGVWKNLKKISFIFLQKFPENLEVNKLKNEILNINNIQDIHALRAVSLDDNHFYLRLHVCVPGELTMVELDELKAKIKKLLKQYKVITSTLEFESYKTGCIQD